MTAELCSFCHKSQENLKLQENKIKELQKTIEEKEKIIKGQVKTVNMLVDDTYYLRKFYHKEMKKKLLKVI